MGDLSAVPAYFFHSEEKEEKDFKFLEEYGILQIF